MVQAGKRPSCIDGSAGLVSSHLHCRLPHLTAAGSHLLHHSAVGGACAAAVGLQGSIRGYASAPF